MWGKWCEMCGRGVCYRESVEYLFKLFRTTPKWNGGSIPLLIFPGSKVCSVEQTGPKRTKMQRTRGIDVLPPGENWQEFQLRPNGVSSITPLGVVPIATWTGRYQGHTFRWVPMGARLVELRTFAHSTQFDCLGNYVRETNEDRANLWRGEMWMAVVVKVCITLFVREETTIRKLHVGLLWESRR